MGIIDGRDKNRITYESVKVFTANTRNLKKYHLDDDSKTIAMVEFSTKNISVPYFSTFAEKLTLCVPLRPLMEKGNIKVIQTEEGKVERERVLEYKPPKCTQLLMENEINIPNESVRFYIEINKANEPLTQGEKGKFREGGLLIMSGTSVHESTLLKYENDPNASKFFGKVRCDYIDELMRKDEAVVTPDRQGLNWDYPFMKKLKSAIENKLKPFVDLERKERDKHKRGISKETLKRNERLGKKLGKLYKDIMKEKGELSQVGGPGNSNGEGIAIPSAGFGFIPNYYAIEVKKKQRIRLVIRTPKVIPSFEKIYFKSKNELIAVERKDALVSEGEYLHEDGVYIHRINVSGDVAGESGVIVARTKDKRGDERVAKAQVSIKQIEGYPPNGFSFVPMEYRVRIEKTSNLTLKVDSELFWNDTANIKITSDNEDIIVETPQFSIQKGKGIIKKKVKIRGTRTGAIGIITAIDEDDASSNAEAKVKVISNPPKEEGFIIEFDDRIYPIQRSQCDGNVIYIYTKEPTVKMYFGNDGEYDKTLSFQVICADLITDAFCSKAVMDLDVKGKIIYLGEDKETGIRRALNQLKKKIGPKIHDTYVDKLLIKKERENLR